MTLEPSRPNVLVVCTANVCRSPVVERLLPHHFAGVGVDVTATSAGTHGGRNGVHPDTAAAAREHGVDVADHWSRRLTRRLLDAEGQDLVVAMTRDHVYHVIAIDESAWPRTFTLPELVRRAEALDVGPSAMSFDAWVGALADGRRSSDLLPGRASDDIVDPYGRARRHHRAMVREVDGLCRRLARSAAAAVGTPSAGGL